MILVTDFDNTLYSHSDPQVLTNNLQASKSFRQNENKFVLASGRSVSSLGRVLPNFHGYFDYLILDNGAVCLDQNGKITFQCTLPKNTARNISQDILQKFNDKIALVYYHSTKEWPTLDQDITKLRCWTTNLQTSRSIIEMINRRYGDQVKSFLSREVLMSSVTWIDNRERYHFFIDMMPKDAGKENAIYRLASLFSDEPIIAVGDDTNDIDMLTKFDGYAMQDSVQEVLDAVPSNHIISSVAELIRQLTDKN